MWVYPRVETSQVHLDQSWVFDSEKICNGRESERKRRQRGEEQERREQK